MDIGTMLKKARTANNLSMTALAKLSGVPQSSISEIESGKRQPSFENMEKLITALGFTLSDFFAEEPNYLPPELAKIAKQYNSLTEKKKNAIRAILDLLEE